VRRGQGGRAGKLSFQNIGLVNPDVVLAVLEKCVERGAKEIRTEGPHGILERSSKSGELASVLKSC